MHDLINLVLDILIVAAFWWAAPRSGEHFKAVAVVSTVGRPDASDEEGRPAS